MHAFLPLELKDHFLVRVDGRIKLLCAAVLLSMVLTCRGALFPLLVTLLCLSACLSLRVPARRLAVRFLEPAFIVAVLVAIKLLFTGKEVMATGHLFGFELAAHRDGLMDGLMLASRIIGSVWVVALLGFATPFTEFLGALAWVKVPRGLIEVATFAYRYIFLLLDDATVIYHAQKMRLGYSSIRRGLRSSGVLAGALTLKAFDGSQRAAVAMIQRGYDGSMPTMGQKGLKPAHVVLGVLFLVVMGVVWMM